MPSTTAQTELAEFLRAIERGSDSLTPEQEPQDAYAGNVSYAAWNGWRVVVFNDANEWDYIFSIATSDGRVFDHEARIGASRGFFRQLGGSMRVRCVVARASTMRHKAAVLRSRSLGWLP